MVITPDFGSGNLSSSLGTSFSMSRKAVKSVRLKSESFMVRGFESHLMHYFKNPVSSVGRALAF